MGNASYRAPRYEESLSRLDEACRAATRNTMEAAIELSAPLAAAARHVKSSKSCIPLAREALVQQLSLAPMLVEHVFAMAAYTSPETVFSDGAFVNAYDVLDALVGLITGSHPGTQRPASSVLLAAMAARSGSSELAAARTLVHLLLPAESLGVALAIALRAGGALAEAMAASSTGAETDALGAPPAGWAARRFLAGSPIGSYFSALARAAVLGEAAGASSPAILPPLRLPPAGTGPGAAAASALLDVETRWALAGALPPEQRGDWVLLYNSQRDGESFAVLEARIIDRGPTLVLMRDAAGACFGAYASQPWRLSPNFYGDERCLLFSLRPLHVYAATGRNGNYMYLNSGTASLPNGLGLGGQAGFYALWLDASFIEGVSRGGTNTYASPCLASDEHFRPVLVEVWSVQLPLPDSDDDETAAGAPTPGGPRRGKSSVRSNAEARAFLEIAGVRMHDPAPPPPEEVEK